jgi:hypothetical protein
MWHYKITDIDGNIIIDSSLREDFYGYSNSNKAYMIALGAKIENRLSDLHTIKTFEVIPDCALSLFESTL